MRIYEILFLFYVLKTIIVKDLSELLKMVIQTIITHLKILEKVGLILRLNQAYKRPSKLEAEP